ncbi:S-layer homology domain-containing protein [Paenibacillus roseipurpureus]|uniref:S-layer homology domain-containing protein n=1 Tax=Paenibacillus roseopurpureus TaxID=2918901 RepID=A0AA96LRJ5_9BACL|nr:S-layer homology domain-containing protein [Paenibacillus sp. MBLB1832]WNR45957.1 S-layer homology domain-containing protein [Paenibacillus sp. MBLB1832]
MKKKAHFLLFLIAVMICSLIPTCVFGEAAGETLTVDRQEVSPSSTFTITGSAPVSDLYGFEVKLTYDRSKLEFVNAVSKVSGGAGFAVGPILKDNEIVYAYTKTGNQAGNNGTLALFNMTFRVKDGVSGKALITWNSLKMVKATDLASTTVSPLVSTTVTINAGESTPTSAPTPTPAPTSTAIAAPPTGGVVLPPSPSPTSTSTTPTSATPTPTSSGVPSAIPTPVVLNPTVTSGTSVEGTKSYAQVLPVSVLQSGSRTQRLQIQSRVADVELRANAIPANDLVKASEVKLVISEVDKSKLEASIAQKIGNKAIIDLKLLLNGQPYEWKNNDAPVTVSIPYTPTPEELKLPDQLVVWYIDGSGNFTKVPSGRYDSSDGKVRFTTTHFSSYAIGYDRKIFSDLAGYEWAKEYVEALAAKGIVQGTSESAYSPGASITRADFAVLLTKTLGLTGNSPTSFVDVPSEAYYAEAVSILKSLGIAQGDENMQFHSSHFISREDMMTLTARALILQGRLTDSDNEAVLSRFMDSQELANYASKPIGNLVRAGIVEGSGTHLYPKEATTRAEAAVFLYRIYQKIW